MAKHLWAYTLLTRNQEKYISTCNVQILNSSRYIFLVDPNRLSTPTTIQSTNQLISLPSTDTDLLDDFFTCYYRI